MAKITGAANEEVYCELRYQGQYLSPDPIGLGGGIRPQGYVHNPLTWVDPLGLAGNDASSKVANARARQAKMLEDNVGYNISPKDFDKFSEIGMNGTFITDKQGALKYFDGVQSGETTISRAMSQRIETDMGLKPGSLKDGFNIRKVEGITNMQPRSPIEGNTSFLGSGQHLPGGAPEMVINSIPTSTPPILKVNVL